MYKSNAFFSLGCGIGYGYLHRIPVRTAPLANKTPTVTSATTNVSTVKSDITAETSKESPVTISFPTHPTPSTTINTLPMENMPVDQQMPPGLLPSSLVSISLTSASTVPQIPSAVTSYNSTPPLVLPKTTPPVNFNLTSTSHSMVHPTNKWTHPPHPVSLGGATTVQASHFPPNSGLNTVMPGGVLPLAATSKRNLLQLKF